MFLQYKTTEIVFNIVQYEIQNQRISSFIILQKWSIKLKGIMFDIYHNLIFIFTKLWKCKIILLWGKLNQVLSRDLKLQHMILYFLTKV